MFVSCGIKEPTVQSQSNIPDRQAALKTEQTRTDQTFSPTETITSKKATDYFAHFNRKHGEILREWLKQKTFLRPAVEEIDDGMFHEKNYQDKVNYRQNFENNMKMLRDAVGENGYQYYSVGDMNGDGNEDFAVLLVDIRKQGDVDRFALAIFNGPLKMGQKPSYYEDGLYGITNS